MRNFYLITLLIATGSFIEIFGKLPSTIPVCSRNHPRLSECILGAVKTLQPRLATGNLGPGLTVPSLEPLHLQELKFGEENGLKIHLSDVKVFGASNFKVEKFRINLNNLKMDIILHLPRLEITGHYHLKFRFLGQFIENDGDYAATFENAKLRASVKGHRVMRDGLEYAKLEPVDIFFNRGKISNFQLKNLLGENPILSDIIHALITSNPDYMVGSIRPKINAAFSRIATEIVTKIMEDFSLDELFPK